MVNWKQLKSSINNFVQIGRKSDYEVLWVDEFADPNVLGETRFDPKQIVIKNGLSPKLTMITFIHEVCHAYSDEYELEWTESQIQAMEKGFYYLLKDGNLFKTRRGANVRRKRQKVRRKKT